MTPRQLYVKLEWRSTKNQDYAAQRFHRDGWLIQAAAQTGVPQNATHELLDSVLWAQTSVEHDAACEQD